MAPTLLCPRRTDGFWVGKASLRSWRQLALEQLNEPDEDAEHSNGKMNGNAQNKGNPAIETQPVPPHKRCFAALV